MAINNPYLFDHFDQFEPVIEYVDAVRNNPSDIRKVHFKVKGDKYEVIKWCRRNFGDRGDGWDFSGGNKGLEVTIWSKRLITMWELWQN